MWNRISGKSSDTKVEKSSPQSQRKSEEERLQRAHRDPAESTSSQTHSQGQEPKAKVSKNIPRQVDERGFNPTSTSYSSTSRSSYPGTASASVATASGNHDDDFYTPPGLIRNASLANQMPKSKTSRSDRGDKQSSESRSERRNRDRDDGDRKRGGADLKADTEERRNKRDKDQREDKRRSDRSSQSVNGHDESYQTSRGPGDFPEQIGAAGFSQFPGQYDTFIPHTSGAPPQHPMSSHVQDQFPGQFPDQSTAPYHPPAAASAGGPGLAAEYYGDAGESVLEQPGNRTNTPSLIVGAEPHLQAALAVAAPPPEPSASGGVGAAASFFSGEFDENDGLASHEQETSSTYATAPVRPTSSHHTSSASALPSIGVAAMGATAGYALSSEATAHAQHPYPTSSVAGAHESYSSHTHQRPPSPTVESYYSHSTRPSKPHRQSSHSSNIPLYAAGLAGAAGMSAAAYHPSHYSPSRPQQHSTMVTQHRHHGPLGALVDFFKDPEGVAQFEEYSEIVGICKYCFAPGSSPRDAPRKHHYRKRRSTESLGRVDKESRYYSSENEIRRRKEKSWIANGLAGYGLAKLGENVFRQRNDFDDTYSVKTGRRSPTGRHYNTRRRSQSRERFETGITTEERIHRRTSHTGFFDDSQSTGYPPQSRRRSRSRSRDRKSSLADAALGAAVGSSLAGSLTKNSKGKPPKREVVTTKHRREAQSPRRTAVRIEEQSPKRQRSTHKKKKS